MKDLSRLMCDALSSSQNPFRLTVHIAEDEEHPLASELLELASSLHQLDGEKVELRQGITASEWAPPALPALSFGPTGGPDIVNYLALPEGPEEAPFVELLRGLGGEGIGAKSWLNELEALKEPAEIIVFIAPGCPHCPKAVSIALEMALVSDWIKVSVIDAMRFTKLAERYKVQSVPVTVIDGGLSFTGVVPGKRLVEHLLARGNEAHYGELFRSLVTAGRHEEAAESLLDTRWHKPFLDWWGESTLTDRISLMLVCEEALERDPRGLDPLVEVLIDLTKGDDVSLRGDTADLLGKIGNFAACEALRRLCRDPNPDVAEIATEVLEELEERRRADAN